VPGAGHETHGSRLYELGGHGHEARPAPRSASLSNNKESFLTRATTAVATLIAQRCPPSPNEPGRADQVRAESPLPDEGHVNIHGCEVSSPTFKDRVVLLREATTRPFPRGPGVRAEAALPDVPQDARREAGAYVLSGALKLPDWCSPLCKPTCLLLRATKKTTTTARAVTSFDLYGSSPSG